MLGLAFESRKKLVFWFFAFFAKFRPASGDPSLGFGAPFWAPRGRFYGPGARKTQKTKKLRKPSQGCVLIRPRTLCCFLRRVVFWGGSTLSLSSVGRRCSVFLSLRASMLLLSSLFKKRDVLCCFCFLRFSRPRGRKTRNN